MTQSQGEERDESLHSMHKMSNTAGLSEGEYAAINAPSVWTLFLGVASLVLPLFDNVLLVVPLAGIICGLVAIRQVNHSNGTQTGRGFALSGLALCLLGGGGVAGYQVFNWSMNREDQGAIVSLISEFERDIKDKKTDDAYALFSDRFRERVLQKQFKSAMASAQNSPLWGGIESIRWNGKLVFDPGTTPDERIAVGMVIFGFEKAPDTDNAERMMIQFRKEGAKWKIDNIPAMFPSAATEKRRAQ